MTVEQLDAALQLTISELQDRMQAYDERESIRLEARDDGKSTTERAVEALQRPERFSGERDIALNWLRDHAPTAGIFRRETS